MGTIGVLGTFDTKGKELEFVADTIRQRGHGTLLIDLSTAGRPQTSPDIGTQELAAAAGVDFNQLGERDRGQAVKVMGEAAAKLLPKLVRNDQIQGVIALGGSGGTSMATMAMRTLPIGFPKLMVSTVASGNTAPYVGTKDIVMFPSVVDVAGLNSLSRTLFQQAAGAVCGMVESVTDSSESQPLIVASMFGNTTDCVSSAKEVLEQHGYEVLVFHATGSGGKAMEDLIRSGLVAGVLDITTTELADHLLGGNMSAGPNRLLAAAELAVPSILVPGCLDMANFGGRQSLPTKFAQRTVYEHNPDVTLLRTSPTECESLGKELAQKANAYQGPVTILLPTKAISVISAPGQAFHEPQADAALFSAIRQHARVPIIELDQSINDAEFAHACAETLLEMISAQTSCPPGN